MPDTKLEQGEQITMPATTLGDVRYWVDHVEHLPDHAELVGGPVELVVDDDPEA